MKDIIIDLGMHPFADTFVSEAQLNLPEPVYPLQCKLDQESGLVKLVYETSADQRYNLYDYSYTSANSKVSREHWDSFATSVTNNVFWETIGKVLEIGSNDGYLSKQFKDQGHSVLGIDPSRKMCDIANERGIDTICGLFSYDALSSDSYDLVVANNVFNHANDPLEFAKDVERVLSNKGTFVFEVPYWYNTIVDKRFDQIYHEHVSYFTVKAAVKLLAKAGLTVYDVQWVDYHGGSIRVFAKKGKCSISEAVNRFIHQEEKEGLFTQERYDRFMKDIKKSRALFLEKLYAISKTGKPIVGIGAAAKGNTFLNFYNIDNTVLDYVTDVSEYKIGKYTPLTRIPILDDKTVFEKYDEVYAIILSWNISDLLKEKLQKISKANITFLTI